MITAYFILTSVLIQIIQGQPLSLSSAKDYKTIPGSQLYLIDDGNIFSYLSLTPDSNSTLMNATLFYYTKSDMKALSLVGEWIAVGFASNEMANADIVLCSFQANKGFCKDYLGVPGFLQIASTSIYTVNVNSRTNIPNYGDFKTEITFQILRQMNSFTVIEGSRPCISAYGALDNLGNPQFHNSNYAQNLYSLDKPETTASPLIATTKSYSFFLIILYLLFVN